MYQAYIFCEDARKAGQLKGRMKKNNIEIRETWEADNLELFRITTELNSKDLINAFKELRLNNEHLLIILTMTIPVYNSNIDMAVEMVDKQVIYRYADHNKNFLDILQEFKILYPSNAENYVFGGILSGEINI